MEHAHVRYLESKRSVDARALNRRVRDRLLETLPPEPEIVEFAAGTGVTVPRLIEWGVTDFDYRGIEQDPDLVRDARRRRVDDLADSPGGVTSTERGFRIDEATVEFHAGDALAVDDGDADLVVAQAFADLVPLDDLIDALNRVLGPDGVAYLPITFDGSTLFQPDHPADDRVETAYHDWIAAKPGRDPRAGRHLLDRFRTADGDLLAAGASDWIVRPSGSEYPADEAFFLSRILAFVADALDGAGVDGADDWIETRREQLAAGELTYVAHQYDLLYAP
ncbi:methyltransferase domain-containing protein [Halolamina litorea]|uniref:SAM-dependent methyltransferase n=1 Tax=Halolamina litorea TaxID=1515593 RepID=A0ABD6BWH7_9EURY|nr:class I SAM-dependent methyltransferase [Halolamina litorea]